MAQTRDPSVVVPYKNVPALIGYYLGIFSLIPCLGGILPFGAIPLGIIGLKNARANPQAHGKAHAWVAIVLGSLALLAHLAVVVLISLESR